ncbi:MAG: V-type ATP synthase subunit E [Pyramidobacter sp.]|nr:V-type ATP synthase subunit E [Pyramidobacter sp.]
MALADIRKKIEQDAANEASALLDQARKQADALNAEADAEVSKSEAYYQNLYEVEAPEIFRRAEIVAGIDVKKLVLGAKQELIGKSYDMALENLCALSDDAYLAFMEKLLDQAVSSGNEELLIGANEKKINQAWLDAYNSSKGKNLTLAAEKADIKGGFILRNGKISENCSLETLLRWLRDDLESDVVKRLFGAE